MKKLVLSAIATTLMASSALATDIQTRTVSFENEGSTLSGTLYLPADHENGDRHP